MTDIRITFWGTSHFSVIVLDEMVKQGILPALIVTAPARPKGRGLALTPSDVKVWADKHGIHALEPAKLDHEFLRQLSVVSCQLFIVASYGKIIPRTVLDMPEHGTLNVHPSLLPHLRGASPLQTAILEDVPVGSVHETGVTIMQMDEEMDHGHIVAQEKISIPDWPPKESDLEETLGMCGGKLLAKTIPRWVAGEIMPTPQDHARATYTQKITKQSGKIDLADNPAQTYRKIRAYNTWPRVYFLTERGGREIRVIVTDAEFHEGKLVITHVIPEGKREMSYKEFLRGQRESK
ncbi:MAG: Methionyl-tRNA formyltransferase [Parcubacteria group bacterium GW2011_GWA2_49_16]|nr:MAG: Methionyl-tRNA formyltransferase [Parcubacteria group bacterium GW2011_GWA2_49_16]